MIDYRAMIYELIMRSEEISNDNLPLAGAYLNLHPANYQDLIHQLDDHTAMMAMSTDPITFMGIIIYDNHLMPEGHASLVHYGKIIAIINLDHGTMLWADIPIHKGEVKKHG